MNCPVGMMYIRYAILGDHTDKHKIPYPGFICEVSDAAVIQQVLCRYGDSYERAGC